MDALRYAARPTAVLKYFGQLCTVFGVLSAVPLAVALASADTDAGLRYAVVAAGSVLLGFLLTPIFSMMAGGSAGLSAGISGPELHPFLKGVLCADMLLGRLEILAWLVLVSPGTWLGNRLED